MKSSSFKIPINQTNSDIIALVVQYLKIDSQYYDDENNYWLVYLGNDKDRLHISKEFYFFESATSLGI